MKKDPLLIIHQGALGDFVLTLPLLLRLKDKYPIDIFCPDQNRIIALYFAIAERTFSLEMKQFSSVFSTNPDPALINMLNNYKNILVFSFSEELRDVLRSITDAKVFLVYPRPEPGLRIHVAEYIKNQLEASGFIGEEEGIVLPNRYSDNLKKITIIHPGAGSRRKRWDLSNFLKLYKMLQSKDIETEFLIGPAEEDIFPLITRVIPREKVNLIYDMSSLLVLLESAKGIIGNDSGVIHLSAFMGIRTLAIFGPSDPTRWRPLGENVLVVRPQKLNCRPCFEIKKENCPDPLCLKTKPEMVFQNYLSLISQGHP